MSFKDLTTRAAAAFKSKPAETEKTPAKKTESKETSKEAPEKSKTS